MLDERSLRKPTFDESTCHPIVFGDAGTWWLPKPHVRTRFVFGDDHRIRSRVVVTDDPEFNALAKAIEENDTILDVANMAAWLLRRNYDLTADHLGEILEFDPADQSPERWTNQVLAVAYGRIAPKA